MGRRLTSLSSGVSFPLKKSKCAGFVFSSPLRTVLNYNRVKNITLGQAPLCVKVAGMKIKIKTSESPSGPNVQSLRHQKRQAGFKLTRDIKNVPSLQIMTWVKCHRNVSSGTEVTPSHALCLESHRVHIQNILNDNNNKPHTEKGKESQRM